jgi:hypothetical protein
MREASCAIAHVTYKKPKLGTDTLPGWKALEPDVLPQLQINPVLSYALPVLVWDWL